MYRLGGYLVNLLLQSSYRIPAFLETTLVNSRLSPHFCWSGYIFSDIWHKFFVWWVSVYFVFLNSLWSVGLKFWTYFKRRSKFNLVIVESFYRFRFSDITLILQNFLLEDRYWVVNNRLTGKPLIKSHLTGQRSNLFTDRSQWMCVKKIIPRSKHISMTSTRG